MAKRFHYTYRLRRKRDGALYIGVRSCDCPPEEDTDYMSSSRLVNAEIKAGVAYTKKILVVWGSRKAALEHEVSLHMIHDVARNPKYLNIVRQTVVGFNREGVPTAPAALKKIKEAWSNPDLLKYQSFINSGALNPRYGTNHTKHTRALMRSSWDDSRRQAMSDRQRRSNITKVPEVAEKISAALKGKAKTEAHCKAMSAGWTPSVKAAASSYRRGAQVVNNGIVARRIFVGQKIPKGFVRGALPEPMFTHRKHAEIPPSRKSFWSRWANKHLEPSKIKPFLNQLTQE